MPNVLASLSSLPSLLPLLVAMPRSEASIPMPGWTVVPFAVLLLGIAILPLAAAHWWEHNRNKLIFALACGVVPAVYVVLVAREHGIGIGHGHPLVVAMHDYISFILLLFALFAISGGIYIGGTLAGTPVVNTSILAIGGVIASFVGTTGASMLLIRPLLRANAVRKRKAHVVIFFIFVVSNCGGLLTPLGDPPLFLGFLKGVPFTWTFQLWKEWLLVNGVLLVAFQFLDSWYFHREDVEEKRTDLDEAVERAREPMHIRGGFNFVLLAAVVAVIYCSGKYRWPVGAQEGAMLVIALVSIFTTAKEIRAKNSFSYAPILEVAALFLGIFLAMVPALVLLNQKGPELGISSARGFYWATGALSSFLDNAPTYLTFASVAAGMEGVNLRGETLANYLALGPEQAKLLAAISCGAVMMGANTYIGNGPNFMVKSIAESAGVKMPSFFGYMGWSIAVLIPLFVAVTFLFF